MATRKERKAQTAQAEKKGQTQEVQAAATPVEAMASGQSAEQEELGVEKCSWCLEKIFAVDLNQPVAAGDEKVFCVNIRLAEKTNFHSSGLEAVQVMKEIVETGEGLFCAECAKAIKALFHRKQQDNAVISIAERKKRRAENEDACHQAVSNFLARQKNASSDSDFSDGKERCFNCLTVIPDFDLRTDDGGESLVPQQASDKKVFSFLKRFAGTTYLGSPNSRAEKEFGERIRRILTNAEGGLCQTCGELLRTATNPGFCNSAWNIKTKRERDKHERGQAARNLLKRRKGGA